jgi:cell division protein FtsL
MKDNFLCKEVKSANLWHLVFGIIYAVEELGIIYLMIRVFLDMGFVTGICMNLILLCLLILCLLCTTTMIKTYVERTLFTIYYAALTNMTDIDMIKSEYSIHMIGENGILFTKKEDDEKYSSYCLMNNITEETIKESILAERVQSYEN